MCSFKQTVDNKNNSNNDNNKHKNDNSKKKKKRKRRRTGRRRMHKTIYTNDSSYNQSYYAQKAYVFNCPI